MKAIRITTATVATLTAGWLLAQETPSAPTALTPPKPATPPASIQRAHAPIPAVPHRAPRLPRPVASYQINQVTIDPTTGLPVTNHKEKRFDLDFPGGPPHILITAISKALGKPVNAIIPTDVQATDLPALHLKQVTVSQLFDALKAASMKRVRTGYNSEAIEEYGFRTADKTPTPNSIWTFSCDRPLPPLPPHSSSPNVVRFYQLGPYLGTNGYKVDDITTAVQTGCEMLGTPAPKMKFHKETQLLIAVGHSDQLDIIDQVLKQLRPRPQPHATLTDRQRQRYGLPNRYSVPARPVEPVSRGR